MENKVITEKSEILFLYEGIYNEPNGDPFTGEQRYDEETKKILISDVRIKRYIRDYIDLNEAIKIEQPDPKKDIKLEGELIYVKLDRTNVSTGGKESGAAARLATLKKLFPEVKSSIEILKKCIDVRLFGGISTEEGDSVNLTGPVQFALLNPSLNKIDLRMHQNTSVFPSKMKTTGGEEQRGTIGTKTVVPYSINQIHGWVNPKSATITGLTDADKTKMFKSLWRGLEGINTRTKAGQYPVLLLEIIYAKDTNKIYRLDQLIKIETKDNLNEEQIRSRDNYTFKFDEIFKISITPKIEKVRFYTEIQDIENYFKEGDKPKLKFEKMDF